MEEEFEDIKGEIRIRKLKDRQHCGQKKYDKMNKNDLQNIVINEERTRKCLRQVEHIRGHLWHRYSVAVIHGGGRKTFEVICGGGSSVIVMSL